MRSTLPLALAACLIGAGCGDATSPSDAPDQRPIVYFRLELGTPSSWALFRVSATGGPPVRLSLPMAETLYPAVSADGSRLAFVAESEPAGVYVGAADGSGARLVYPRLTQHVAWSPDGTKLAFAVDGEILVVGADGSDPHAITTAFDEAADHPSWSPSGRIAFSTTGIASPTDIYTMAADGSDVRLVVAGDGQQARDPAWSPDGSRLAFAYGPFGASAIFTVDPSGNDRRRVTPEAEWGFATTNLGPAWAPSGGWIAFQREHTTCTGADCYTRTDIFVARADGRELWNVTPGSSWGGVRPSW